MKCSRHFRGIILLLLAVLVGLLAWHTDTAVQRERLNYALIGAVRRGDVAVAQTWIERGADVNVRMRLNQSAPTLITFLKSLLHRRRAHEQKENYPSALLAASKDQHWNIVKCLVEHGADVNQRDEDSQTPLIQAAWHYRPDVVQLLLDHGAQVNASSPDTGSVLYSLRNEGLTEKITAEENQRLKQVLAILVKAGAKE